MKITDLEKVKVLTERLAEVKIAIVRIREKWADAGYIRVALHNSLNREIVLNHLISASATRVFVSDQLNDEVIRLVQELRSLGVTEE